MKTILFCLVFSAFLLFTDTKSYRQRETLIQQMEAEIDKNMVIFDSLYSEGVLIGKEIDSLEVIMNAKREEINKLKRFNK